MTAPDSLLNLLDPDDQGTGTLQPPTALSPSSMALYHECPRRYFHAKIERRPDPSGWEAVAGTYSHHVLELLMQLPARLRTVEKAREIASGEWGQFTATDEYVALGLDRAGMVKLKKRAWEGIVGYFSIEDPVGRNVVDTERHVTTRFGDVPVTGKIDRVDAVDGGEEIIDYKNGKRPSWPDAKQKADDQGVFYAAAVEASGKPRPVSVRFIYTRFNHVEHVTADDEAVDALTAKAQRTWKAIMDGLDGAGFEPNPTKLCPWCPFNGICPAYNR